METNDIVSVIIGLGVAFYFSKKAQTLFFHLLYSFLGVYMILTSGFINPLYNMKLIVGIGLLAPQLLFIVQFTKDTILTIKMMTANTYYFFITLYYKIIRFINWVQNIPQEINNFFSSFGHSKQDDSQEETYEQYKEQYESKHQQQYQKFYKKDETQNQHQQQEETQTYSYSSDDEFAQFYSESAYTVLGVNSDDNFKTIKKAYHKLLREYHPDLNPENIKLYTEITQHINDAYEKIERWKK
ncbi:MAG: DnaJ domain-containing protein [Campylobacteraceae bacterium]|nr:DnaJ domain-containing protein [Campylobacteraceae bacterium]